VITGDARSNRASPASVFTTPRDANLSSCVPGRRAGRRRVRRPGIAWLAVSRMSSEATPALRARALRPGTQVGGVVGCPPGLRASLVRASDAHYASARCASVARQQPRVCSGLSCCVPGRRTGRRLVRRPGIAWLAVSRMSSEATPALRACALRPGTQVGGVGASVAHSATARPLDKKEGVWGTRPPNGYGPVARSRQRRDTHDTRHRKRQRRDPARPRRSSCQ